MLEPKLRGKVYQAVGTVSVSVNGEIRKKFVRASTGLSDKRKATEFCVDLKRKIEKELTDGPVEEKTFDAAAASYIRYKRRQCRFVAEIHKRWRDKLIDKIRPFDVVNLANEMYPTGSPATKNRNVITPAQAVINHAAQLGMCEKISVKRFPVERKERPYSNDKWIMAFREHSDCPYISALVQFCYATAARVSEALNVTPEHINYRRRLVLLEKTKTGKPRLCKIPKGLLDEIMALEPRIDNEGIGRVFGRKWRSGGLYKRIRRICDAAGIEYLSMHESGRHGFATKMAIEKGMPLSVVARHGGWAGTRMLDDRYVHAEYDGDLIDDAFGDLYTNVTQSDSKKKNLLRKVKG